MGQYSDDANPARGMRLDQTAGQVEGTEAGVTAGSLAAGLPGYGVLAGYYVPVPAKVAAGERVAAASGEDWIEKQRENDIKYADESVDPYQTFAPTPSIEAYVQQMNNTAAVYQTPPKQPLFSIANHPSTQQLAATAAALPADPSQLPSSDAELLALVMGAGG